MLALSSSGFAPAQLLRDHHAAGKGARDRLVAAAITEEDAKGEGFHSISRGWAIRRYDQCLELEEAVRNIGAIAFRLVLKDGRISIWRKK